MVSFAQSMKLLEETPPTEKVYADGDAVADAFLSFFMKRLKSGTLPNLQTVDDVVREIGDDVGLFVVKTNQAKASDLRRQRNKDVSVDVSLDGFTYLEDPIAAAMLERVEAEVDLDTLLSGLSDDERHAVDLFITAWTMRQNGEAVPVYLRKKLSRARQEYGFAFTLT